MGAAGVVLAAPAFAGTVTTFGTAPTGFAFLQEPMPMLWWEPLVIDFRGGRLVAPLPGGAWLSGTGMLFVAFRARRRIRTPGILHKIFRRAEHI